MCKKPNYFVLNSYVLSLQIFADATPAVLLSFMFLVPTPHCCFSGFCDVIRIENSRDFFRSNTCVRQ